MTIAQAPLQSVQAQFSYAHWNDLYLKEKPYKLFIDLPQKHAHAPRTNLSFQPHATPVYDVRGNEAEFVMDKNGFEILRHGTEIRDFGNVAAIEQIYFTEMKELIMGKVDGAKRVEVFDWRVSSCSRFCPTRRKEAPLMAVLGETEHERRRFPDKKIEPVRPS